MRYVSISLFLSFLLIAGASYSQGSLRSQIIREGLSTDYPYLLKVSLRCDVAVSVSDRFYYYGYTLASDKSNRGNIWYFDIDIVRSPGTVRFDTVGLKFATDFEEGQFRRSYVSNADSVVAVGFPSLPNLAWSAEIVHGSVASFDVDTLLPEPGSLLTGFIMMSEGLPGIREFIAYPEFNIYKYYPNIESDTTEELSSLNDAIRNFVDSLEEEVNYHGCTVGPIAPPIDFSVSAWIDTLISYKHQSLKLGWLKDVKSHKHDCDEIMRDKDWYKKNDFWKHGEWDKDESWDFDHDWDNGVVKVLDRRLEKARQLMVQKDSVRAGKELEAFVMEVELINEISEKMEKEKENPVMTSEAYALLKYNAEYLIDKLPDRHGKVYRQEKSEK